jgi:outer membrane protein
VVDVAEARLRATRLVVDQATAAVFFAVLEAEKRADTFEGARTRDLERLREIRERAATGIARRTEVLFVETDLARTEASLALAREDVAAAREQLALLIGRPAARARLVEPTAPAHKGPIALVLRPLRDLVAEAFARRPDLRALREQVEVEEGALGVAIGGYIPNVDLTANAFTHRDGTLEDVSYDVTIDVVAPLFEGLRTTAEYRDAESRRREALFLFKAQAREAARDIARAYHALRASIATRSSLESALAAADENFRLLEAEYRLGLASNLELVAAQQELTAARLNFETQRVDEQRLAHELRFLLGGLDR